MTEKEYRAHPAISRSELWKMSESPEKFKWHKENPQEPTPALIFGQYFHSMVLTPEQEEKDYILQPMFDKRTKQGKADYEAFLAKIGDRTPVTLEMASMAINMNTAIEQSDIAKKLLSGEKEVPFFWKDELTGEECKCRIDSLLTRKNKAPIIVDLKTTDDASTEAFTRSAIKYGYDFQAAMYSEGVKANLGVEPLFVFLVVEKKEPYALNILHADELMMRRGYDLYREYLGIYHECKKTNNWYGYLGPETMINKLSLPAWLAKEFE